MDLEFTVKVDCGDVFINGEFVSQLCWDNDSIGYAITNWLNDNYDKDQHKMTVEREINGVKRTIELTDTELEKAYRQQEDYYYSEDAKHALENSEKNYTDDEIWEIVDKFKIYLEHNDTFWDVYWNCMNYAIEDVLKK